MKMSIQHKIQTGFAVALAFLLLTGASAWWSLQRNVEAFRAMDHTEEVIEQLNGTLEDVLNIQTGTRGFAISGDEKFLAPYQAGLATVETSLAAVKRLTQADPGQQRRLAALEPWIQRKISLEREIITLRRSGDTAGAQQIIISGQGKQTMDEIRKRIAEIEAEEYLLYQQRTARAQASSRTTMAIVAWAILLAFGLVGIASVMVRRDFEKRQRAEAERDRFFTISLDLLCIAGTDGWFKRVNPAFTATLGWSAEELMARPFIAFVHPDDHAATLREVEKLAADQPTIHFENRYQCKDGSWKWLSWHTMPEPDGTLYASVRDVTALRQAEEDLRRSEQEFRSMAEAMPQIVWATRPDGWNIFFNQQWVDYTGLTMEESHGHGWNKPFHPDDQQRAWDAWQRATEHNERYSLECRLRRADGVYRWWLIRGAPMRGANGKVLKWFGTCTDIEESKQAQEALHRSEENLYVTLASIGDAVLATDAAGRVTRLNPVAEKLTGWTLAEAEGRPVAEVFHIINEETREPAVIPVEKVLATGEIHGLANHTVIIARDGTERPIADSAAPIRSKDGQVVGVVLVFRDVTEEKNAERAIRESERRLRTFNEELERQVQQRTAELKESERQMSLVLDNTSEIISFHDTSHRLIWGNKAYLQATSAITGREMSLNDLKGRQCFEVWNLPNLCTGCPVTVTLQSGKPSEAELTPQNQDGWVATQGSWSVRSAPVLNETGDVVGAIEVAHDITERVKQERLLQRSSRMESIGTLAGGVAHDLNNALAPVMMGLGLLKMRYPQESELVDTFEISARRGADMVRQLLTFAKGVEGERVPLQLDRLVKEIVKLTKGSFPKDVQFVVTCHPKLPPVLGDATQLHQVLMNLCVNARDAMPHGGTLTLEAQRMEVDAVLASSVSDAKPGTYVALRVRDTGTGIPPEILDRIFDPFFSTKGPDKGTGLGLCTVAGIVRSHGGFLQAYSQPGQGATFTAYLPVASESSEQEPLTEAPVVFRGQNETILFVDDEPTLRHIARVVLRRLNFNPLTATDGTDGVMQAAQHRTELRAVITDVDMPHMDGLAFVRALRQMLPDLPIVVSSGGMDAAVAGEFRTLGVTNYLDKPFTEVQLAEALRTSLSSK